MPTTTMTLPLGNGSYKNVDGIELTDRDAVLVDCFVDEFGFTRKRPGMAVLKDISATLGISSYPINGLFWWPHKSCLIAVGFGKVLKVVNTAGTISVTDLTSSALSLNVTPSFATDGTYAFLANGGKIAYTDGTTSTAYITDADAPTTVTHLAWMDGYLFAAGDGTNKFYWSDVNNPLSWNALNYASAEGDADIVRALKVYNRQIFLFGPNSLEVWENDGVTPFIRVSGGMYNVGLAAAHSVIATDQAIYWLSDGRRVVRFQNGTIQISSSAYDKDIFGYSTVSDCRAYRAVIDGKTWLVFIFPSDGKTLVYCENDEQWHEWSSWDITTGERGLWIGECVCWVPDWSSHIVGGRTGGKLYNFSSDYYDDAGDLIRMQKLTGFIDYGVHNVKRSEEISFRAKRGVGGISRDPKLQVRWNDDNKRWSNWKHLSLGQEGDSNIMMKLHRTGIYKARQYEIVCSDSVPIAIGNGKEKITVLGSS